MGLFSRFYEFYVNGGVIANGTPDYSDGIRIGCERVPAECRHQLQELSSGTMTRFSYVEDIYKYTFERTQDGTIQMRLRLLQPTV